MSIEGTAFPPGLPLLATRGMFLLAYIPRYIAEVSIANATIRAYVRDPLLYPDPETFKPERFLKDGRLNPGVQDPAAIIFGYGRRYADSYYPASCQSPKHKSFAESARVVTSPRDPFMRCCQASYIRCQSKRLVMSTASLFASLIVSR